MQRFSRKRGLEYSSKPKWLCDFRLGGLRLDILLHRECANFSVPCGSWNLYWKGWFSVGGFVDLIVLSLLASAFIYIELPNLIPALLLAFVLALQARLLARAFKSERSIVLGYYGKLTKARADSSLGSSEYVESYKHLREHANAFLIVLFEAALGLILYFSESLFTSIAVLVLWISPAAIIWFFGNLLEHEYVNQKIHS